MVGGTDRRMVEKTKERSVIKKEEKNLRYVIIEDARKRLAGLKNQ